MSLSATSILLNSANRENFETTNAGNCRLVLSSTIPAGKYAVVGGKIDNMVYTVTNNTRTLIFVDSSATTRTITLTEGFYTGSTLVSALKTAMDAATVAVPQTFTVALDSSTQKITITSAGNFSITYAGSTIAPIIGLKANKSTATSAVMDSTINLTHSFNGAFIEIAEVIEKGNDLRNNVTWCLYYPMSVGSGSLLVLGSEEVPQIISFASQTGTVTVRVLNQRGENVDLNSGEWQLLLKPIG